MRTVVLKRLRAVWLAYSALASTAVQDTEKAERLMREARWAFWRGLFDLFGAELAVALERAEALERADNASTSSSSSTVVRAPAAEPHSVSPPSGCQCRECVVRRARNAGSRCGGELDAKPGEPRRGVPVILEPALTGDLFREVERWGCGLCGGSLVRGQSHVQFFALPEPSWSPEGGRYRLAFEAFCADCLSKHGIAPAASQEDVEKVLRAVCDEMEARRLAEKAAKSGGDA